MISVCAPVCSQAGLYAAVPPAPRLCLECAAPSIFARPALRLSPHRRHGQIQVRVRAPLRTGRPLSAEQLDRGPNRRQGLPQVHHGARVREAQRRAGAGADDAGGAGRGRPVPAGPGAGVWSE